MKRLTAGLRRPTLALRTEQIRQLTTVQLGGARGGLQCTQSCDQCSLWPQCPTETSTSTF